MTPPTRENVLDLPARRRIVEHVQAHPGIHLRALAEQLGVPVSSLEYHIYHLLRTGHLSARDEGGHKAFFPAEGLDRRDKDILALVRQDVVRRVCAHLALHPGATPKELHRVAGVSAATLSFHLKKLRGAGITEETPAGRTKHIQLVDAERVANVLVTYRESFLDGAVDRFAKAWMSLR